MIDNPNRNIMKHYGKYQIRKYYNGRVYYYGTFTNWKMLGKSVMF